MSADRKLLASGDVAEVIEQASQAAEVEPSAPSSALAARRMFGKVRARSGMTRDAFLERVRSKLSARYPGRDHWSPMEWLVCAWLVVDGPDTSARLLRLT